MEHIAFILSLSAIITTFFNCYTIYSVSSRSANNQIMLSNMIGKLQNQISGLRNELYDQIKPK